MAVNRWGLLFVILCACSRVTWSIYRHFPQPTELWTAYYSLSAIDCLGTEKHEAFPAVFGLENNSSVSVAAPANLNVSYIYKRYNRRRRKLYPGIMVEFEPPANGREYVKGYELMLYKHSGVLCVLVQLNLADHPEAKEEKIRLELYPISDNTLFEINTVSLPLYNTGQKTNESRIMTGSAGYLGLPVLWVPENVTNEITHIGDERLLDIIFTSPPPQFRFRRFEIALLPTGEGEGGVQLVTTNKCSYTFRDVAPGVYKLQIRPVDDFFSQQGKCLCHYRNRVCTTCTTTKVKAFPVE